MAPKPWTGKQIRAYAGKNHILVLEQWMPDPESLIQHEFVLYVYHVESSIPKERCQIPVIIYAYETSSPDPGFICAYVSNGQVNYGQVNYGPADHPIISMDDAATQLLARAKPLVGDDIAPQDVGIAIDRIFGTLPFTKPQEVQHGYSIALQMRELRIQQPQQINRRHMARTAACRISMDSFFLISMGRTT
jgi:hypothetical protein